MVKRAVLEWERLGLVLRVTHLAFAVEGLNIVKGAASDGGARNPPQLAGALSPRLLNTGSDNLRHATRQIPSEKTIRLPAVFSFHWPCT